MLIGCNSKVQKIQNSVSVWGVGTVSAEPDMVQISFRCSHIAPTTKEAKKAVEQTMQQILKILQEEKIEDKFVKTVGLYYDEAYVYKGERRILIGRAVRQTTEVTINDIINSPERFSSILDKISEIDKVEVLGIDFGIENKTELFKQSRELAYQKALEKANQYAQLSGRKIGEVITVSERVSPFYALYDACAHSFGDSSIPTGKKEVTTEINVVFSLE